MFNAVFERVHKEEALGEAIDLAHEGKVHLDVLIECFRDLDQLIAGVERYLD
jgi:hypothetical protein